MTTDEMIDNINLYVTRRQLGVAEHLASHFADESSTHPLKESGYAILAVVVSYFEMIAQFVSGSSSKNKSEEFFVRGFRAVYPDTPLSRDNIETLYRLVRCGMYHDGMTKAGVHLSRYFPEGFALQNSEFHINPARVVDELRLHFTDYVARLRDPANVTERAKFDRFCREIGVDNPVKDTVTSTTTTGSATTTTTDVSTTPSPCHPATGK